MPAPENLIYRTKDNKHDYSFVFETQSDGSERAYILSQPGYGNRSVTSHSTHRYYDSSKSLHYICFDPEPKSRKEMIQVAAIWAENTERYRKTGTTF